MKRLFALLLAAAVLSCAGCSDNKDMFSDKRSKAVIAASADLNQKFDGGTRVIYPDYYGGRSFSKDGKKMFVYVTPAYDSELDFLLDKHDCVEFIEVVYSKNELNSLADQYREELEESFPELNYGGLSIDETGNSVVVHLNSDTLEDDEIMSGLKEHFEGRPVIFGEPITGYAL
ncbi:MAG: hypothetical protein HDR72_06630 [Ruminococcaceae bacterium]|nr:hypothetical protein [Oscillospiraceae bacterium]